MVRWKRVSFALGFGVILLSGTMMVSTFVPDTDRYANVVDLTQDRLMETVRRIEFYKLQTGAYPASLSRLLKGNKEPIRLAIRPSDPIRNPLPEKPSPIAAEQVKPLPVRPITDPLADHPSLNVAEVVPSSQWEDCIGEKVVYRDIAVSDLDERSSSSPELQSLSDDNCRIKEIVVRDRPVLVSLPESDVITDPSVSGRRSFFYERTDDGRYYLRAVGPDGVAFTGDDMFPDIDRTDDTRIGFLETRQSAASVGEGG